MPIGIDKQISRYVNTLSQGRTESQRSAHMMNLAMATCKWLILQGESDNLRLQAAKLIFDLPPVQARMGAMTRAVQAHYHQHVHVENPKVNQALMKSFEKMLETGHGAEVLQILAAENTPENTETPPNPLETEENR